MTDPSMSTLLASDACGTSSRSASMAAKKKPVRTLTLADAGIDPAAVGLAGAATEVVDFAQRPPRQAGVIVKDEGDGGVKIADYLAAQKFV